MQSNQPYNARGFRWRPRGSEGNKISSPTLRPRARRLAASRSHLAAALRLLLLASPPSALPSAARPRSRPSSFRPPHRRASFPSLSVPPPPANVVAAAADVVVDADLTTADSGAPDPGERRSRKRPRRSRAAAAAARRRSTSRTARGNPAASAQRSFFFFGFCPVKGWSLVVWIRPWWWLLLLLVDTSLDCLLEKEKIQIVSCLVSHRSSSSP